MVFILLLDFMGNLTETKYSMRNNTASSLFTTLMSLTMLSIEQKSDTITVKKEKFQSKAKKKTLTPLSMSQKMISFMSI